MLLASEIYTTFTFLGGSGFAYGRDAQAVYIIACGAVAYILLYSFLPAIWSRGMVWKVFNLTIPGANGPPV